MSPRAIDLERLATLLDAYGGAPERWPEDERDAALALLAASADARRLHEEACRLDAVLDALPAAAPTPALEERIVAAARAVGRAPAGQARVRELDASRAAGRRRAWRRLPVVATALPLAAAAALALWVAGQRSTPADEQAPAADTVEIQLADLGVYETPSDVLLDDAVVDQVYEAEAWAGCEDGESGELGCPELDTLPLEPVSRGQEERSYS